MILPGHCAKRRQRNPRKTRQDSQDRREELRWCRVFFAHPPYPVSPLRFQNEMNFLKAIVKKFTGQPVDWDALEESLIRADLGVPMTLRIIKALQERAQRITITATDIAEVAREEISRILPLAPLPITPLPAIPKLLLL